MFEVGDIVAVLDSSNNVLVDSIAEIVRIYPTDDKKLSKSIRVVYWKTSALFRNDWGVYFEHEL